MNCFNYLSVRCIWLYELIISRTRFKVNPHSIVAWMSGNYLLEAGAKSEFQISEVEIDNVGSTLLIWTFQHCSTSRGHINLPATYKQRWNACWDGSYMIGTSIMKELKVQSGWYFLVQLALEFEISFSFLISFTAKDFTSYDERCNKSVPNIYYLTTSLSNTIVNCY